MASTSDIEWTDATWNPVTGCSIASPGCTHCYAMQLAGTRLKNHESRKGLTSQVNGNHVWTGDVRFNAQWLDQPLRWQKPRMIFVCAHGDLFHEKVPDQWIDQIFAVMALCPQHTFQVLTKRPKRMRDYLNGKSGQSSPTGFYCPRWNHILNVADAKARNQFPEHFAVLADKAGLIAERQTLPNVWLGTSVENQPWADQRKLPMLDLAKLGWTTFVSYEPALGPVDWQGWQFLKWFICGGESGNKARPMHPDWARTARDFCEDNDIPFLFKQWGAWMPWEYQCRNLPFWQSQHGKYEDGHALLPVDIDNDDKWDDGLWAVNDGEIHAAFQKVGKKTAGRTLDGIIHDGFPQVTT